MRRRVTECYVDVCCMRCPTEGEFRAGASQSFAKAHTDGRFPEVEKTESWLKVRVMRRIGGGLLIGLSRDQELGAGLRIHRIGCRGSTARSKSQPERQSFTERLVEKGRNGRGNRDCREKKRV